MSRQVYRECLNKWTLIKLVPASDLSSHCRSAERNNQTPLDGPLCKAVSVYGRKSLVSCRVHTGSSRILSSFLMFLSYFASPWEAKDPLSNSYDSSGKSHVGPIPIQCNRKLFCVLNVCLDWLIPCLFLTIQQNCGPRPFFNFSCITCASAEPMCVSLHHPIAFVGSILTNMGFQYPVGAQRRPDTSTMYQTYWEHHFFISQIRSALRQQHCLPHLANFS